MEGIELTKREDMIKESNGSHNSFLASFIIGIVLSFFDIKYLGLSLMFYTFGILFHINERYWDTKLWIYQKIKKNEGLR